MPAQPYTIVDAFTERPFGGNPAAVLTFDGPMDDGWMQLVAREFNLSETAFAWPEETAWRLRWFTPTVEVDACGHATLATAHVLLDGAAGSDTVEFVTRSGRLTCRRVGGQVAMDWPADPCDQDTDRDALTAALGAPVRGAGAGRNFNLAEMDDAPVVRALHPDLDAVSRLGRTGLIVTAEGDAEAAVVSRVFAPQSGIPEDPVTGSAHCSLAPWWAGRLGSNFLAEQVSPRGGRVDVRLSGDRVELRGHAVTMASGQLTVGSP